MKMTSNYYKKNKVKLWKEACKRYQNLSEEKEKSQKNAWERYQNFTEEKTEKRCLYYQEHKQKMPEYRKIII